MKTLRTVALIAVMSAGITFPAFASWWNPFTWFTQTTKIETRPSSSTTTFQLNLSTTVSQPSTTTKTKKSSSLNQASSPVKESTQQKENVDSNETISSKSSQPVTTTPPANSTLCNGLYYSSCPAGSDLVCPSNGGKAYCQISQQQEQVNKEQTIAYLQSQLQMYQSELTPLQNEEQNYQNQYDGAGCNNVSSFLTQATGEQGLQAQQKASNCASISQAQLSVTQQITPIYDAMKLIQQKILYIRGY